MLALFPACQDPETLILTSPGHAERFPQNVHKFRQKVRNFSQVVHVMMTAVRVQCATEGMGSVPANQDSPCKIAASARCFTTVSLSKQAAQVTSKHLCEARDLNEKIFRKKYTHECFDLFDCIYTACDCDEQGSVSLDCNDLGVCECKTDVVGDKCDRCREGYFGRYTGKLSADCKKQKNDTLIKDARLFLQPAFLHECFSTLNLYICENRKRMWTMCLQRSFRAQHFLWGHRPVLLQNGNWRNGMLWMFRWVSDHACT